MGFGDTRIGYDPTSITAEPIDDIVVNEPSDHDAPNNFCLRYARFLKRHGSTVIIFWVVLLACSAYWAPKLLADTEFAFRPPSTTAAAQANRQFNELFPSQASITNLVMVATTTDGSDVRNATETFSPALALMLNDTYGNYVCNYESYWTMKLALDMEGVLPNISNLIANQLLPQMNGKVIPHPTSTMIVVSNADSVTSKSSVNFANDLMKIMVQVRDVVGAPLDLTLTGLPALYTTMIDSAEDNLELMDAIILPVAFFILAIMLGSFRLLLIPLLALAITAALSFATVDGITHIHPILSAAPSLMASVFLAMSIDYSMFLLTRFKLELSQSQGSLVECVATTISTSGRIILASGSTLAICFLGLLLLPLDLLQSIGIGCAISLIIAMAINLSLCPVMLLKFPKFFAGSCFPKKCGKLMSKPSKESLPLLAATDMGNKRVLQLSRWHKIATWTQNRYLSIAVIVAVIAGLTAIGLDAFNPPLSASTVPYLPRGSAQARAIELLAKEFTPGVTYPYSLVIQNENVLNETFIVQVQHMISSFYEKSLFPPKTVVESYAYVSGLNISAAMVTNATDGGDADGIGALLRQLVRIGSNFENTAMVVTIQLGIDPMGSAGANWVRNFRQVLQHEAAARDWEPMYLSGFAGDVVDSMDAVHQDWVQMVGIVSAVVFLIVGFMMKSLVVAVRCIISITMTVVFVFGFAKYVYCDGVLSFIGFGGFHSTGTLVWFIPPTIFPLVVGIALDYDIFLVGRIIEFRESGLSYRNSIIEGVAATGTIITAAGVIQGLAFFGLLLSDVDMLNQLSFFLMFAVLFDTFLIRTLVVPCIMGWLGDWNWWPHRVPQVHD